MNTGVTIALGTALLLCVLLRSNRSDSEWCVVVIGVALITWGVL